MISKLFGNIIKGSKKLNYMNLSRFSGGHHHGDQHAVKDANDQT
jgi:hypothetical protein